MMEINSRIFGQICIDDSKVLHFVNGIVGFPQLTYAPYWGKQR